MNDLKQMEADIEDEQCFNYLCSCAHPRTVHYGSEGVTYECCVPGCDCERFEE